MGETIERDTERNPMPIPELVSAVYENAPAPLRAKLLETLLRPLGTLALSVVATGAFSFLSWREARDAVGVSLSLDEATRITSDHVLELARFVEQASPDALLRFGSLVADSPLGVATVSGAALLIALAAWRRRPPEVAAPGRHQNG